MVNRYTRRCSYRRGSNKIESEREGGGGRGLCQRVANEFFLFNFREVLSKICALANKGMSVGEGGFKKTI